MKIRTWDTIVVITWKDKGKTAKVLKALPTSGKVIAEGINVVTKHIKKQGTQAGQIIKMEKAIDVSNVMMQCPFTEKPTRVGYVMIDEKGKQKKFRFSKKAVKENKKEAKDCIIK